MPGTPLASFGAYGSGPAHSRGLFSGPLRHLEYFHDHVRIERIFFEGVPAAVNGELRPDLSRSGMGLELKQADAKRFAA